MTQMIPLEKEVQGMATEDHEAIEVRGEGLDPQEGMGPQDPWDQLALEDFRGGMDYPPPGALLLPQVWEYHLYLLLI